jgi:hypothetical protein
VILARGRTKEKGKREVQATEVKTSQSVEEEGPLACYSMSNFVP